MEFFNMISNYTFARGRWSEDDFLKVRSPRWVETSHWEQLDDCIANNMPSDIRPEDMQMGRDRTGETYISMLLKRSCKGSVLISTDCAFDGRMAPLIVLSKELSPVHTDHMEVVLYDHGVNLWHHYFVDGKPSWKLIGFLDLSLERGRTYHLSAQTVFNKKGVFLIMSCDGHSAGCRIDPWPEEYYTGFTACEGRNRFYNFAVEPAPALTGVMAERFSD